MVPLNFLGMANIAVRLVTDAYPGAQLYEGDGRAPNGPTTDVQEVDQWRFVFRTSDGGTALINSTEWGEFGPITYVDEPWLGDVVIPWPIEMDIVEADQLLKGAGYTGAYGTVTLRWPLHPGSDEPDYIFGMAGGSFVFVGVYTKSVTTEQVTAAGPASGNS